MSLLSRKSLFGEFLIVLSFFCLTCIGKELSSNPSKGSPKIISVYTSTFSNSCYYEGDSEQGGDQSMACPGINGYIIRTSFSAFSQSKSVQRGDIKKQLSPPSEVSCEIANYGDKVEWRVLNNEPIAIILRVSCYENSGGGNIGKRTSEFLLVEGLEGHENLSLAVDVNLNKHANQVARQRADEGY